MNILLTCAGRRNYLVNYFKEALRGKGKVAATDVQLNAPALVDADIAVKVPSIYEAGYIDTILSICKEYSIKALISLNDLELPLIAANKPLFEELGVKVIVSDPRVIDLCFDKWKTKQFLEECGLKVPKTYLTLDNALEALRKGEISFPVVVKPRWGSASIGLEFPASEEELLLAYRLLSLRLSQTILAEASSEDADKAILIQEKLEGKEYGMDVLNDLNGNFAAVFAKIKLSMRDGETDKSMSVCDERFSEIGRRIGERLRHIGNLDTDVFESGDGLYILELNPRFGGGYPFTHEAGAEVTKVLVEWIQGGNQIEQYLNFKPDKAFAKCDRLLAVPVE